MRVVLLAGESRMEDLNPRNRGCRAETGVVVKISNQKAAPIGTALTVLKPNACSYEVAHRSANAELPVTLPHHSVDQNRSESAKSWALRALARDRRTGSQERYRWAARAACAARSSKRW